MGSSGRHGSGLLWSVFLVMCFGVVALGGCTTNPATGERIFTLMSWEQEIQLGSEAASQFTTQNGGEVSDTQLRAYVSEVGRKLLPGIEGEVPDLPWEFTLVDSDQINAFALPGGKVFFTRGLASKLSNEAQMAGVLGHEIGHVTARHGNQRLSKEQGLQFVLAAIGLLGEFSDDEDVVQMTRYGVPALSVGGQVALLKYGREQELEADALGMRYMSRAGYDPAGQKQVMEVLARASQGARPPEILSSHPYPENRISQINELLRTEFAGTQNNDGYTLGAERYRARFLSRLRQYSGGGDDRAIAAAWCAHCAAGG